MRVRVRVTRTLQPASNAPTTDSTTSHRGPTISTTTAVASADSRQQSLASACGRVSPRSSSASAICPILAACAPTTAGHQRRCDPSPAHPPQGRGVACPSVSSMIHATRAAVLVLVPVLLFVRDLVADVGH